MNTLQAKQHLLYCPGDLIQEIIDEIGMSQKELAERMGRSESKLNELIKGKAPITTDTAIKLSRIIGLSEKFWINKEARYQTELAEIKKLKKREEELEWLKKFNIPELVKHHVIPKTTNKSEQIESLLRFFRIGSSKEWYDIYPEKSVSFKIALKFTNNAGPISVWLRLGELEADKLQLEAYDKAGLRKALPDIQQISFRHSDKWMKELQNLCATYGLAVAYTPMVKSAPISGAAYWIKNGKTPIIQLTSRHKNNYAFWFHFYHELAHVLLHGKKDISLKSIDAKTGETTTLDNIEDDPIKEGEANNWASKELIPSSKQNYLDSFHPISRSSILGLSNKWKIHPGILVGYLARHNNSLYRNKNIMSLQEKVHF